MGNIINDGGTTDWSGLTEIKFDSDNVQCSAIDSASNLLDIFSSNQAH